LPLIALPDPAAERTVSQDTQDSLIPTSPATPPPAGNGTVVALFSGLRPGLLWARLSDPALLAQEAAQLKLRAGQRVQWLQSALPTKAPSSSPAGKPHLALVSPWTAMAGTCGLDAQGKASLQLAELLDCPLEWFLAENLTQEILKLNQTLGRLGLLVTWNAAGPRKQRRTRRQLAQRIRQIHQLKNTLYEELDQVEQRLLSALTPPPATTQPSLWTRLMPLLQGLNQ
jgi:hypothetical protein